MHHTPDVPTGEAAVCRNCREVISAVIDPYSGVIDWGSHFPGDALPGDFGCDQSPDTNDEGSGCHDPGPHHTPVGFRTGLRFAS